MNIDTILISEYASGDNVGRLTVANAFNTLHGPGPKWGLPLMYLTMVAHGPVREAGRTFTGEVRVINAAQETVVDPVPFEFAFPPAERAAEGMPVRAIVSIAFAGLKFTAPGAYALIVNVEETYAAATTLYVNKVEGKGGRGT